MSNYSDVTRRILQAYGYTPKTLAIDLDVSQSVARRILHGTNELWSSDYYLLRDSILGVDMSFLFGELKPGTMRAERERRDAVRAEKERREAERKAARKAEPEAEQEKWRNASPQEKCVEYAEILARIVGSYVDGADFTLDDLLAELRRQLTEKEGATA